MAGHFLFGCFAPGAVLASVPMHLRVVLSKFRRVLPTVVGLEARGWLGLLWCGFENHAAPKNHQPQIA